MKIIALLPVKNEEWILPAFLDSVWRISDEVIAVDNGSTDSSKNILQNGGVKVMDVSGSQDSPLAMSFLRQRLLEEGRSRGGTHFVWLDADELFTEPFFVYGKKLMSEMNPGDKILMQWLALWKSPHRFRDDDSVWSNNYKDFVYCDDGASGFEERYLSEARTPGKFSGVEQRLSPERGAVLHYQFVNWERFQLKQARYRCLELIRKPGNAEQINSTYSITLDDHSARTVRVPEGWLPEGGKVHRIEFESVDSGSFWHDILRWFDMNGVEFFEELDIWHIDCLLKEFVARTGRFPKKRAHRMRNAMRLAKRVCRKVLR